MNIHRVAAAVPIIRNQLVPISRYTEFSSEIANLLRFGQRSLTLSLSFTGYDNGLTLKFTVKSINDLEVVTLKQSLDLAKRMDELGVEKIVFYSGVKRADTLALIKTIIYPFFARELEIFSRPHIEVHFKGKGQVNEAITEEVPADPPRPAIPPPVQPPIPQTGIKSLKPADNPYWGYKIQLLYQVCRKIDSGRLKPPAEELGQLKAWLEFILIENNGTNFNKYYAPSQRQWFRDFYEKHFSA